MSEVVIGIPTMVRDTRRVACGTLRLKLQKVTKVVCYCHNTDLEKILEACDAHGVDEVIPHNEPSIDCIRWFIKNDLDNRFPTFAKYMWDDDIYYLAHVEIGKLQAPEQIHNYLVNLSKKAEEEAALSVGVSSTERFVSLRKSKFGRYSVETVIKGIIGFPPGIYNPFGRDPKLTSLEETIAYFRMKEMAEQHGGLAALRHNYVYMKARTDTPRSSDDPQRLYAIRKAISIGGAKDFKRHHRKLSYLIE